MFDTDRPWRLGRSILLLTISTFTVSAAAENGDPQRGEQLYRACIACHSLAPGEHRTGPSLADIRGRKAGSVPGFQRYSRALMESDVVWDADTLDAWLQDPAGFIPGNEMIFAGIDDAQGRADLIAFLQAATTDTELAEAMGGGLPDLKELPSSQQVAAIVHCGDTYRVTTLAGETHAIWEFNLRLKTDSSPRGPVKGTPALLPAGMMGDRFSVIFTDPAEISDFIKSC